MSSISFHSSYSIKDYCLLDNNIFSITLNDLNPVVKYFAMVSVNGVPYNVDVISFYKQVELVHGPIPNMDVQTLFLRYYNNSYIDYSEYANIKPKYAHIFDPQMHPKISMTYGLYSQPTLEAVKENISRSRDLVFQYDENIENNFDNTIAFVNGVYHPVKVWKNKAFVIEGWTNMKRSGRSSVVFVDTTPVGGHITIPLNRDITSITLRDNTAIVTTSQPINKGTNLLCVMGSLFTPIHGVYKLLNETTFTIDLSKLDLKKMFCQNPNLVSTNTMGNLNANFPSDDPFDECYKCFTETNHIPSSFFTDPQNKFIENMIYSRSSALINIQNSNMIFEVYDLPFNIGNKKFDYIAKEIPPYGVLIYDGIHTLPYTVLRNEKNSNVIQPSKKQHWFGSLLRPTYDIYAEPEYGSDNVIDTTDAPIVITKKSDVKTPTIQKAACCITMYSR